MYKFDQNISKLESTDKLHVGFFIWVWYPSEKSPHLGVSIDGHYFSLQHNGKQENIDVEVLLKHIRQKKYAALLVGLNKILTKQRVEEVFSGYSSCEINNCSCSKPLFELFGIQKENGILFDILEHEKDAIYSLSGIGLQDDFEGIPSYTFEDVLINLNTLAV